MFTHCPPQNTLLQTLTWAPNWPFIRDLQVKVLVPPVIPPWKSRLISNLPSSPFTSCLFRHLIHDPILQILPLVMFLLSQYLYAWTLTSLVLPNLYGGRLMRQGPMPAPQQLQQVIVYMDSNALPSFYFEVDSLDFYLRLGWPIFSEHKCNDWLEPKWYIQFQVPMRTRALLMCTPGLWLWVSWCIN